MKRILVKFIKVAIFALISFIGVVAIISCLFPKTENFLNQKSYDFDD